MYQVRLRVRVGRSLDSEQASLRVQIAGRSVEITSGRKTGQPLAEADWLILKSRGFPSQTDAEEFGRHLKAAVGTAGVCCFLGVDLGNDQPTTWMEDGFARAYGLIEAHERLHPNVHGLAILEDDPNIRFPAGQASLTVRTSSDEFLKAIQELSDSATKPTAQAWNGLRLLNQAFLNPQALAQLVLSISAVEALGKDEKWSKGQKDLLKRLASEAQSDADTSDSERAEVADAVSRSHRIGLRQGVKRVLARLDMMKLLDEWDRIYEARSGIFHGTLHLTESEIMAFANDAIKLCGHIILSLAERDGLVLPPIAFVHIPTLRKSH